MTEQQPTITALRELGGEFDRLEVRSRTSRRRLGLGALVLTALVAVSPPGQALAERFGDLLGIGDVPREEGHYGSDPRIVGVGTTPAAHPYEAVVSGDPAGDETCVFLGFVEIEGTGMGSCLNGDVRLRDLSASIYRAPKGILEPGSAVVQGLVSGDVAAVEVTYADAEDPRSAEVALSPVSASTLRELDLEDEPFGFYVSFLEPGVLETPISDLEAGDLEHIEIRALDSAGAVIARQRLDDSRFELWLDNAPLGRLREAAAE